jgi:hypothetical protein
MKSFPDPKTDGILISLKKTALGGKGGRGQLYDQGVLSVIKKIEAEGSFDRDPITLVCFVQEDLALGAKASTKEEQVRAQQLAQERGLTFAEAVEYGHGVAAAENLLSAYKRDK